MTVSGKVTPNASGAKVVLQRRKNNTWKKVAEDKLDSASKYSFKIKTDFKKRKFRIRFPGDKNNEANSTKPFTIETK